MEPRSVITAQIQFIDERVNLVHIPLSYYSTFVQPLLQILYPDGDEDDEEEEEEEDNAEEQEEGRTGYSSASYRAGNVGKGGGISGGNGSYSSSYADGTTTWQNQHSFLNISFTPLECSIVCSKHLVDKYFAPIIERLPKPKEKDSTEQPMISKQDFIVISVEGEGLEAGQRVLELTSPLAMAGISIFFITTYFSDYILVPSSSRSAVISALSARGFVFSQPTPHNSHQSHHSHGHHTHHHMTAHHRNASSTSLPTLYGNPSSTIVPSTPPPKSLPELESRTFALLARHGIKPQVHSSLRLLHCAGHASQSLALQIGLARCIAHPPKFMSLTLTETEAPSLLIAEDALRKHFSRSSSSGGGGPSGGGGGRRGSEASGGLGRVGGGDGEIGGGRGGDVLLGNKDAYLIPITLDLRNLPFEATGIACGVAGRLVGASELLGGSSGEYGGVEMSYLSTAKSGTVMVEEAGLNVAIRALKGSGGSGNGSAQGSESSDEGKDPIRMAIRGGRNKR